MIVKIKFKKLIKVFSNSEFTDMLKKKWSQMQKEFYFKTKNNNFLELRIAKKQLT